MNDLRYFDICDRLAAAASNDLGDSQLNEDAELAIRGLLMKRDNLEAIISNQRAEIQRCHAMEVSY